MSEPVGPGMSGSIGGAPAPMPAFRPVGVAARPPVTPPRRGGAGPWIGVILGVLLLGSCLVMGLVVLGGVAATGGGGGGGRVTTRVMRPGAGPRIAVIPIHGIIMRGGGGGLFPVPDAVHATREFLEAAATDERVAAVILEVSSPGGEVTACDLIHAALRRFVTESRKPLIAYLEGEAASGGYYVAVAASKIICHPTTITGSIGVRMDFWNVADLAEKHGVKQYTIAAGDHKDMLPFARAPDPESLAIVQGLVDEMGARFHDIVLAGRPGLARDALKQVGDGRILSATQALAAKLVDAVGTFDDAVAEARKAANLGTDATVVRYERRVTFLDMMGARAETPTPTAMARELLTLAGPRLLYLAGR